MKKRTIKDAVREHRQKLLSERASPGHPPEGKTPEERFEGLFKQDPPAEAPGVPVAPSEGPRAASALPEGPKPSEGQPGPLQAVSIGGAAKGASLDGPEGPERPKKAKKKKKAKIPEEVVRVCGHPMPIQEVIGECKGKPCKACRKEQNRLRQEGAAARREARKAKKQLELAEFHKALGQAARLPHGSFYGEMRWDSEKVLWSGSLHIPIGEGHFQTFEGCDGGQIRLCKKLANEYRAWAGIVLPVRKKNRQTEEEKKA